MSEGGEIPSGLSPEERQQSIARIRELVRRQQAGEFNTRPEVPEKAESMLPGIRTVRPAPAPGIPYHLSQDGEGEDENVSPS